MAKLSTYEKAIHALFSNMRSRVNHDLRYKHVTICDEWKSLHAFKQWCKDEGFKIGDSLSRHLDVGDYAPYNCTLTAKEDNIKCSTYIVYDCSTKTQEIITNLSKHCRDLGLDYNLMIGASRRKNRTTSCKSFKVIPVSTK